MVIEFAPGTKEIKGLAYRKHDELISVSFPDSLEVIGDAAFSFCEKLKRVTIPASVAHIGVAAFCKSGVEEVTFLGVPTSIDNAVFCRCKSLKKILVPAGMKQKMAEALEVDPTIVEEETGAPKREQTDLFGKKVVKRIKFNYNNHDFSWAVGDIVSLSDLFYGPITLQGNPSYQYRKKALFIFLRGKAAANIPKEASEYEIPAKVAHFTQKFREKYGNRSPRLFLFLSDFSVYGVGKVQVYDEVRFIRANQNTITVKSTLRS